MQPYYHVRGITYAPSLALSRRTCTAHEHKGITLQQYETPGVRGP